MPFLIQGHMQIKCPKCKLELTYSSENPFRPFCSKRCQQEDLGDWATESYKVPSNEPVSEEDLLTALKKQDD